MATARTDVSSIVTGLLEAVQSAAQEATDDTAELGVRMAKRLAPVRKVSYVERNRQTRSLNRAELAQLPARKSPIRSESGRFRSPDTARIASLRTTVRRSRQALEAPEVEPITRVQRGRGGFRMKNPDDAKHLTARGRAELAQLGRERVKDQRYPMRSKNMSAIFKQTAADGSTQYTLGGRLRGEITHETKDSGERYRVDIISPTEYAEYVEFPTSRTAAQPYMRPTLTALKRVYVTKMVSRLKRISGAA